MINANEIMVGSILNYQTPEGNIAQTIIDWQDLKWLTEDPIGFNLVHSGIPITEEILVKAGFKKHSTNPYWFRNKQICISLAGTIELISWDMQIFKVDTKAIHLHQLQLLFFSLTGQHLNIEL